MISNWALQFFFPTNALLCCQRAAKIERLKCLRSLPPQSCSLPPHLRSLPPPLALPPSTHAPSLLLCRPTHSTLSLPVPPPPMVGGREKGCQQSACLQQQHWGPRGGASQHRLTHQQQQQQQQQKRLHSAPASSATYGYAP